MDKRILQQLYADYGKEILLYLYSLCKDRDMAEDLMQETFEKALLSLSENHTNMRAWLYMVARNLCLNAMKRERRNVALEEARLQQVKNSTGGKRETTGAVREAGENAAGYDILEELIKKEQHRMLYQALIQLPSPKREVLQLQYFSGLSLKEIARVLQISPENARVLSCRARKELRAKLEEEGYEI